MCVCVCTGNDEQKSITTKTSEEDESSSIDDSEEENILGKVLTRAGKEIHRKSAGNVKRSKEEAKADAEAENEFGYTDRMCRIVHCILLCINPKMARIFVSFEIYRQN